MGMTEITSGVGRGRGQSVEELVDGTDMSIMFEMLQRDKRDESGMKQKG